MQRLTGRVNFRRTFRGRIVLQVEEEVSVRWTLKRQAATRCRWRDASVLDLTRVELRHLVDLRTRPYLAPLREAAQAPSEPALAVPDPVRPRAEEIASSVQPGL